MKYLAGILAFAAYSVIMLFLAPQGSLLPGELASSMTYPVAGKPDSLSVPDSLSTSLSANRLPYSANSLSNVCRYTIDARFLPEGKKLEIKQAITWKNITAYPTREVYFHIYPNAYKNGSIFLNDHKIPPQSETGLIIDSFTINSTPKMLCYVNTDIIKQSDSTVAKVILDSPLAPGDSVHFYFKYHYSVPLAYGRFGQSVDEAFTFFAQWFIKPGVFENGKWVCSPFMPYAEFYADFSTFNVNITAPSTYTIESSGERTGTVIMDKVFRKHEFKLSKAHDFAWSATKDYPKETFSVSKSDGEKTQVTIICPPLYKNYIDRYKTALQNAFRYFNYYFAPYPYKTLTLVVTPAKTGRVASMEYPGLITIEHSPFALVQSLQIEKRIIHEFAHQYFYAAVANNETYEGWLDEGLANYLTSRMLDDFGLYEISHFTLFGYLPVQGLELVSIGEIPLVYTLTKVKVPNQSEAMQLYYEHMNEAALCDTSYLLNPYSQYAAITYGKGELFFKTLERISGKEAFMSILKNYYIQNRFKHVKAKDFFDILRRMQRKNIDWLTTNYYKNSYECDYAVESVKYIPERKEARVTVTKKNEGYFPCELSLFTAQDTLTRTVAIDKRRIVVTFSTALPPLGAEIDMNRKNYFDTDFANNSLILSPNMEAPTYISIRWFFWMQSFLLIFGSIV